jgi:hypothetical protein
VEYDTSSPPQVKDLIVGNPEPPVVAPKDPAGVFFTSITAVEPRTGMRVAWRALGPGGVWWPVHQVSYQVEFVEGPNPLRMAARDSFVAGPGLGFNTPDGMTPTMVYASPLGSTQQLVLGVDYTFTSGQFVPLVPGRFVLRLDPTSGTPGGEQYVTILSYDSGDALLHDGKVTDQAVGQEIMRPAGTVSGRMHRGQAYAVKPQSDTNGLTIAEWSGHSIYEETGQIIPVNEERDVEIWWHKAREVTVGTNTVTLNYPAVVTRHNFLWPNIPETTPSVDPALGRIVIASEKGSGPLDTTAFPEAKVYYQNDAGKPGANPNDEHAFRYQSLEGGDAIYALRNDLWNTNATWVAKPGANLSKPYVLMAYKNPTAPTQYKMKVFEVLAANGNYDFSVATPTPEGAHQWRREAPQKLLPPHPINSAGLYDVGASRYTVGGDNIFEDRNGELYAAHGDSPQPAKLDWVYQLSKGRGFHWPTFLPKAAEFSAVLSADSVAVAGNVVTITFRQGRFRPLASHSVQMLNAGSNLSAPLKTWNLTSNTATTLTFTKAPTDLAPVAGQVIRIVNRNADLVWFLNDGSGPSVGDFTQEWNPQPVDYQLTWPAIPENYVATGQNQVRLGETTDAIGDINNQESVEIIHDEANYEDPAAPGANHFSLTGNKKRSLKVIRWGSTSPGRSAVLAANHFPSGGDIEDLGGFKEFPSLSPSLRKKIRYYLIHPTDSSLNQRLVCTGVKFAPLLGDHFFAINVLTGSEADELRNLVSSARLTWSSDPGNVKRSAFNAAIASLIAGCAIPDDISMPPYAGMDVSRFKSQAITAGDTNGDGFVTLLFNNFGGELPVGKNTSPPVSLKVIRIPKGLPPGDIHNLSDEGLVEFDESGQSIQTDVFRTKNPFDERVDLLFSGDFAGSPSSTQFEWKAIPSSTWETAVTGVSEEDWPDRYPGANLDPGWDAANAPIGPRNLAIRAGQPYVMQSHYFISRYRFTTPGHPLENQWSKWTKPKILEGWLIRALKQNSPFAENVNVISALNAANTGNDFHTTMIQLAGGPAREVALTPSGAKNAGLISIYQTLFDRGRNFSLDINLVNPEVSKDLLTAAGKVSDLYLLLGNEAYADAADPTVPIANDGTEITTPGNIHAFMGFENVNSLLDEELALLRGRDGLGSLSLNQYPVYNRLAWYLDTGSAINPQAAAIYYNNYNLSASSAATPLLKAKALYPMGHGDAWGHYLSAQRNYYMLLRNPKFEWIPRFQVISVSGGNARIDRFEERRFAELAAAKARTGLEIVKLTHRKYYFNSDPTLHGGALATSPEEAHWQGYKDRYSSQSVQRRAWGVDDWAARTGEGAYLDWVTGNALLPEVDADPLNTGITRLDRRNVTELDEVAATLSDVQKQLDMVDAGLSPLGVPDNTLPFDIDATQYNSGVTHFEQVFARARQEIVNAYTVFRSSQGISEGMRRQADNNTAFNQKTEQQNFEYRNRLVEVFGYPYSGDTAYPNAYNGPDILHYMYVDPSAILNVDEGAGSTEIVTLRFRDISLSNFSFSEAIPASLNYTPQQIDVPFHRSTRGYGFVKPRDWGSRKAPGEIQLARADVIQGRYRLDKATLEYDNLVAQIEDQVQLLEARTGLNASNYAIQYGAFLQNRGLNSEIKRSRVNQLLFRTLGHRAQLIARASADGVPTNMIVIGGLAAGGGGDFGAPARTGIGLAGAAVNEIFSKLADVEGFKETGYQQAKEEVQTLSSLRITAANQAFEEYAEVKRIEGLIRQESTLRLEIYSLYDSFQQGAGRYLAAEARGQRLLEEYIRFRQRAGGEAANSRYRDLAYRVFRDEKLEKYRAHFDQAAQSLYRAGLALDYEINWKGFDPNQRRNILSQIVRTRAIGDAAGNEPKLSSGDAGLAGIYAQMNVGWQSAKSILRINSPEIAPVKRISLRNELFRIAANDRQGNLAWRAAIEKNIVRDLGEVPDFVKHCDFEWTTAFSPPLNAFVRQPERGMVLNFPTVIASQLNTFGFPFNQQIDSRFVSTSFANRITSVGIWLRGVSSMSPTANVEAYLVPIGNDVLRNPLYSNPITTPDLSRFSEWKVLEELLPLPELLSRGSVQFTAAGGTTITRADMLTQTLAKGWIPAMHSGSSAARGFGDGTAYNDGTQLYSVNTLPFNVRRYGAFLANHDNVAQQELSTSNRLVGRSVWNTRWMLVIPNRSISMDALLNQLTDIELRINYKQYSTN